MSVGMSSIWRAKQPNQKRCKRCELYYAESLEHCVHCYKLNDVQLGQFKIQHRETLKHNAVLGKYLLLGAVITGSLLLFSFF